MDALIVASGSGAEVTRPDHFSLVRVTDPLMTVGDLASSGKGVQAPDDAVAVTAIWGEDLSAPKRKDLGESKMVKRVRVQRARFTREETDR